LQTLPAELLPLIVEFAPLFSNPVWEHAKVLLVGAILAPEKRTVTASLRIMGLSQEKRFVNYHRVLNRAQWSALTANRILLRLWLGLQPQALHHRIRRLEEQLKCLPVSPLPTMATSQKPVGGDYFPDQE
jgi:DDE superfamily endonuclease